MKICRVNKINLRVILPPYSKEYLDFINQRDIWSKDIEQLKKMDTANQIDLIDLQYFFFEENNPYQFFLNPDHLNDLGSQKLSTFLSIN